MRELIAQELELMRSEVNDEQSTTGRKHPRRLTDSVSGIEPGPPGSRHGVPCGGRNTSVS